jgi:hypothetical protein
MCISHPSIHAAYPIRIIFIILDLITLEILDVEYKVFFKLVAFLGYRPSQWP